MIALKLNLRYNQYFNNLNLGAVVLSQSCVLTSSQISSLGLNSNSTINDLLNLANKYLGSNCNGSIYPNGFGGLLTNAVAAINEYWDECQVENNACNAKLRTNNSASEDEESELFSEVKLSPNPAISTLQVTFTTDKTEAVDLRIFNARGQLLQTIEMTTQEGENSTELDLANLKSGIYWLNLSNGETMMITKRFVVFKE